MHPGSFVQDWPLLGTGKTVALVGAIHFARVPGLKKSLTRLSSVVWRGNPLSRVFRLIRRDDEDKQSVFALFAL